MSSSMQPTPTFKFETGIDPTAPKQVLTKKDQKVIVKYGEKSYTITVTGAKDTEQLKKFANEVFALAIAHNIGVKNKEIKVTQTFSSDGTKTQVDRTRQEGHAREKESGVKTNKRYEVEGGIDKAIELKLTEQTQTKVGNAPKSGSLETRDTKLKRAQLADTLSKAQPKFEPSSPAVPSSSAASPSIHVQDIPVNAPQIQSSSPPHSQQQPSTPISSSNASSPSLAPSLPSEASTLIAEINAYYNKTKLDLNTKEKETLNKLFTEAKLEDSDKEWLNNLIKMLNNPQDAKAQKIAEELKKKLNEKTRSEQPQTVSSQSNQQSDLIGSVNLEESEEVEIEDTEQEKTQTPSSTGYGETVSKVLNYINPFSWFQSTKTTE